MEKILKEANVNPTITLSEKEYNRIVSLAKAKAKQIEEMAVEYYKKNGVCSIHVDAYIRERNGGSDEIADTFYFDCSPRYSYVRPSDEIEANPFAIDKETRQRIVKFVTNYITSAFTKKFGRQLASINNARRFEQRLQKYTNRFIIVTLTGWLLAIAMLLVVMLR